MEDWLLKAAASEGFLPHGYCFQWSPGLLGTMVTSDAVIMLAYYSIPLALLAFLRRRKDVPFNGVFVLFAAFIFLCGTTHLVDILTVWVPSYWLQAYTKAVTAAISALTAVLLWTLMPRILTLPSNAQLRELIDKLEHEVAERRAAEARLDELNAQLEHRVLERTRELEASLQERERLKDADRAREVAEAANRAKSDFLSSMSHELRTPLNAILGFSELMVAAGQRGEMAARYAEWAQHILTSGKHLLGLIEDVLDFARIEARGVELKKEPVDIARTLRECETMLGDAARSRNVNLDIQLVGKQPVVWTDGKRIRQVLMNLLSNAIKYNRDGGRVRASVAVDRGHMSIEVRDTGVGLSPEQMANLFQPFNRLGRESDAQRPGTGLGLVVTKQLVEALGGHISVRSTAGEGTEFIAVVPAS